MVPEHVDMMKHTIVRTGLLVLTALFTAAPAERARAFPPAPHHYIYGMIRGEDGEPLADASVQVILETDEGVRVLGSITPYLEPGVNYRLTVPMDAGTTPDPYVPNALSPTVPFLIEVIIGSTTYLPIEMSGDFSHLGEPGESTRIDLTLGVDSDGDGLPDAWEQIVIDQLGGGLTIPSLRPRGDADGDGLSNLSEYIAGTYAFDARDKFALDIKEEHPDHVVLEFLAIRGRTYTVQSSSDLSTWEDVSFREPTTSDALVDGYMALDVRTVQVEVPKPAAARARTRMYRGVVR